MSSAQAHSDTIAFPHLSQLEEQLFEAFASGITAPAALAARLNLPIKSILTNLATPAFLEAIHVLDAVTALLNRHTTRFRHQTAFQALEQALALATADGNPAVMCRIATQLLKPTPPLPDPEVEQAERAERITKSRRAVKDDAKSEAQAAERPTKSRATIEDDAKAKAEDAKAKAEIKALVDAMFPELTIEDIRAHRRAAEEAEQAAASVPSASSRWSSEGATDEGATGDAGSEAAPVHPINTSTSTSPHLPTPSSPHPTSSSPSQSPAVTGHTAARPRAA